MGESESQHLPTQHYTVHFVCVCVILLTGSLLDVRFELNPLGRRADYSVKAQLKPVKIIYDAVRVAIVLHLECTV